MGIGKPTRCFVPQSGCWTALSASSRMPSSTHLLQVSNKGTCFGGVSDTDFMNDVEALATFSEWEVGHQITSRLNNSSVIHPSQIKISELN